MLSIQRIMMLLRPFTGRHLKQDVGGIQVSMHCNITWYLSRLAPCDKESAGMAERDTTSLEQKTAHLCPASEHTPSLQQYPEAASGHAQNALLLP